MKQILVAFVLALASCNPNPPALHRAIPLRYSPPPRRDPSPIRHIVVVIQENRTFDNLFQGFPGANTQNYGMSGGQQITLTPQPLNVPWDLLHAHSAFLDAYDNGANDGWNSEPCGGPGGGCPPNPAYSYVPQANVQPYWDMATQYAIADNFFATNQGPSFPAHQYLISGTSTTTNGGALRAAENPNPKQGEPTIQIGGHFDLGGCDSPVGTNVALIDATGDESQTGPVCFARKSIFGEADTAGVSWRYYQAQSGSGLWNAPDAIKKLCPSTPCNANTEYAANVIVPSGQFLTDVGNGTLAAITYVTPTAASSDHAGSTDGSGPAWVASVVNAIGTSPFWSSTAIFITWDDWGGWYDHVTPSVRDSYELSFRVPLIVVSPYAKVGYVSHVPHEFGSILKFEELTFGLPSMGTTDATADNLMDCFNFSQSPTPFVPIAGGNAERFKHAVDPRPVDD